MSKILITGCAGFMGSHLLDHLLKEGHTVMGLDNYSLGTYRHGHIIEEDLLDKEKTENSVKIFKPDILFHLAAWAHEGLSQFAPVRITENNYNAYLNVLIPCIKYGVQRVVLTSSMSVYGDQKPPFIEQMERMPEDVYAVAKTSMERTTEILSQVHGFDYQIVRPHNVYGPRQNMSDPYRNVCSIFINKCLKGEPFYIYGDGNQTRSFSYVDDVIPVLAKTGFSKKVGQIYNVGPLEDYTINELAYEIMKHFPTQPEPIHLADRPMEVKHAWCTNGKSERDLGYKTSISFPEGIAKMIEWAKSVGPQETKYLDELELVADNTPITWKNKLI